MLIKTSELQGAALDWAVAKCEGNTREESEVETQTFMRCRQRGAYKYSTDWAQAGPIIDREKTAPVPNISPDKLHQNWDWLAKLNHFDKMEVPMYGPTPLIAAMRCYVASKLGDDVEVPEELTK